MARMSYDEFLKESQQTLNACILTRNIVRSFITKIKRQHSFNRCNLYMHGVENVLESYVNWLCDYILIAYSEFTSDLYDAQKRHVQRLIKKEFKDADTSK